MSVNGSPADGDAGLPRPGELLGGKFRIERLLGRGGMGAVFAATHELLAQRVAIKMLLSHVATNREAVARFLNEARAASRIDGEHVARVMDVATLDDGRAYMVIEYLDGVDLARLLEARGPLPVPEAVDYVLQGLVALAQAHALGIVHRDLKPSNLFLARRADGTSIVKVLDFGIAKATQPLTPEEHAEMTRTNSVLGSPQYMAPEQLRNAKKVDARTDVWSVGVMLYELLTGAAPFSGSSFGELFAAILEQTPAPMRDSRPEIDPDLEAVVARCLKRDPAVRFENVAELGRALAPHAPPRSAFCVERIISWLPPPPASPHGSGSRPRAEGSARSGSSADVAPPRVRVRQGAVTGDSNDTTAFQVRGRAAQIRGGAATGNSNDATVLGLAAAEATAPPTANTHSSTTAPRRTGIVATGVLAVGVAAVGAAVVLLRARAPAPASGSAVLVPSAGLAFTAAALPMPAALSSAPVQSAPPVSPGSPPSPRVTRAPLSSPISAPGGAEPLPAAIVRGAPSAFLQATAGAPAAGVSGAGAPAAGASRAAGVPLAPSSGANGPPSAATAAASVDASAPRPRSRVDQSGLAGENPF